MKTKINKHVLIILLIIVFFAFFSRFFLITDRPLHHDEGVNFYFTQQILKSGTFSYDPNNYHGPLYFFSLFLTHFIFGTNELTMRLPAVIFGLTLIFLPVFFIKNKKIALTSTFFLLVSPTLLYYSRYSIHESLLIFLSTLLIFLTYKILSRKNLILIPYWLITVSLLLTTKETSLLPIGVSVIILLTHYKQVSLVQSKKVIPYIFLALLLSALLYISLYSSFFTHWQGITDSFQGFLPWTKRGFSEIGHQKPFFYYIRIILKFEFPLLLLALLAIKDIKKDLLTRVFSIWFILSLVVYSLISYKVPWLIINVTVPMAILAAFGIQKITHRYFYSFVFVLSGAYLGFFAIQLNFVDPWQEKNPLAYVHTFGDIFNLNKMILDATDINSKILIVSDEYWPLPFYLRERKLEYLTHNIDLKFENYKNYDAFIINKKAFDKIKPPNNANFQKFSLRSGVDLYAIIPETE